MPKKFDALKWFFQYSRNIMLKLKLNQPGGARVLLRRTYLLLWSYFLPKTIEVERELNVLMTLESILSLYPSMIYHPYEKIETEIFKRIIRKSDIIVDAGAAIGYYSLLASKLIGESGKVYAFEPDIKAFAFLLENISLNKVTNVIPLQKAISCKNGVIKLPALGKEVSAVALDNFFRCREYPDVIKMDIEGHEAKAFEGMRRIIDEKVELKVLVEFSPILLLKNNSSPTSFLRKVFDLGFQVYIIQYSKPYLLSLPKDNIVKFVKSLMLAKRCVNMLLVKGALTC